jgi:hypothetical protein
MYFRTQSDWEEKNPGYAAFSDPDIPCYWWRAVELTLAVYYYHVHFKMEDVGMNIIFGEFESVLNFMGNNPGSTLSLQTPVWVNNGEPGLYRVVAIYKSTDPAEQTHIAECADGKLYAIDVLPMGKENEDLSAVEKVKIWSPKV